MSTFINTKANNMFSVPLLQCRKTLNNTENSSRTTAKSVHTSIDSKRADQQDTLDTRKPRWRIFLGLQL